MSVNSITFLVYDRKCLEHFIPIEQHEKPDRIKAIYEKLEPLNLPVLPERRATEEDISRCHNPAYLKLVQQEVRRARMFDKSEDSCICLSTGDTPICSKSLEVAYHAAGGVLAAVDAVISGKAKNVFCNIRPPGHHACADKGMGYCLLNNVAIGARYAQQVHGVQRILIVDWDLHHGNGTQEIFNDDPSVFYFSTHKKGIYPNTGHENEVGHGLAEGTKMNHPIASGENARTTILDIFKHVLPAQMKKFRPDLVMISAGFDAGEDDGELNLTKEDFAELTQEVQSIAHLYAKGRLISVLEGGYHIEGTAKAAFAHVKALMEIDLPRAKAILKAKPNKLEQFIPRCQTEDQIYELAKVSLEADPRKFAVQKGSVRGL